MTLSLMLKSYLSIFICQLSKIYTYRFVVHVSLSVFDEILFSRFFLKIVSFWYPILIEKSKSLDIDFFIFNNVIKTQNRFELLGGSESCHV